MRLLDRLRKNLKLLAHLEFEEFSVRLHSFLVKSVKDERDRLCLPLAPAFEINSEPLKFIRTIARPKTKLKATVAQDIYESRVLNDPHRMVQRNHHHCGTELDFSGLCRQVGQIAKRVWQYSILIGEVMLGDPDTVETQRLGLDNLVCHTFMDGLVGIDLRFRIRMRCEQNSKFHKFFPWASLSLAHAFTR